MDLKRTEFSLVVSNLDSTFQNGQRLISNCPGFKHKLDRKLSELMRTTKSFHMVAVSAKFGWFAAARRRSTGTMEYSSAAAF